MENWAVVKTGGKQYKVAVGQTINVEKLKENPDAKVSFDQVLIAKGDNEIQVGTPTLPKAKVTGKVIRGFLGKKIRVIKFKSKSRYLRTQGHRHAKTKVLIEKIVLS